MNALNVIMIASWSWLFYDAMGAALRKDRAWRIARGDNGMSTYKIYVRQEIETTVTVEADNEEEALEKVDMRSFPLPPRDEWSSIKGSFEYELAEES